MNDNVFKNAFVILALYGIASMDSADAQVLVTVAAGGGSRLGRQGGIYTVGPRSSGSVPGPACYGR